MQILSKFSVFLIFSLSIFTGSCDKDDLSGSISDADCEDINCADYRSRAAAQQDFDWNPECRNDLDADNDGLACEENSWTDYYNSLNNSGGGGSSNGCPTTSNCGCSGKNKAPCESDPCCQWIVGTGCRCD